MDCKQSKKVRQCCQCGDEQTKSADLPPYCAECRAANLSHLWSQHTVDEFKKRFLRNQIVSNPMLGLDPQTGLPGAAALNHILDFVDKNAERTDAASYSLFLLDVDNLKAINSAYTHECVNEILLDIAGVFNKYAQKVNRGEYGDEKDFNNALDRAWAFRFVDVFRLSVNHICAMCVYSSYGDEFGSLKRLAVLEKPLVCARFTMSFTPRSTRYRFRR